MWPMGQSTTKSEKCVNVFGALGTENGKNK